MRPVHEPGSCSTSQTSLLFAWTVSPLSISGIWLSKYRINLRTFQYGETRGATKPKANTPTTKRRNTTTDILLNNSTSRHHKSKTFSLRSPTMRDVSRTHRVAFDWLCDRINLDTKIQILYIFTKHQMADMLIKGHFTHNKNIFFVCSASSISALFAAPRISACLAASPKGWMAMRMQEQSEENRNLG